MRRLSIRIILVCLLCVSMYATAGVYQGFSGGMMLHTGYLFGQDSNAPTTTDGALCSPEGATFGIGGALHINLGRLVRIGGEGFVSTMNNSTSTCRNLLQAGSYTRTGWGGFNADLCWRDKRIWPFVGASLGGGSMHALYILDGNQNDWIDEGRTLYHKQTFIYADPYVGFDWCMTSKVHITFRLDWLLAIRAKQAELIQPNGPRLYIGFMFAH